jgi:2,4-dienoyl-CoA reductase-like NADH-dependent reductase (Old Yellow Enzyme family)
VLAATFFLNLIKPVWLKLINNEDSAMSKLFSPLNIRNIQFKNRIFVSPMCQYSSEDGMPNDWHLVHLGSRAVGGAALVIMEATAVSPEGRISPADSGIWSDDHATALQRITHFIKSQGAAPGIQLAHAGRKAGTRVPWKGMKPIESPWQTLASSAIPFDKHYPVPKEMNSGDLDAMVANFEMAAQRSRKAGFEVVEIHMAHGYLLHEFLSPLSNKRCDKYGGSFENRIRFPLRIAKTVRRVWPQDLPVFVRISSTDWVNGGWNLTQSIQFSALLKEEGIDLVDCSGGGIIPGVKITTGAGYQTAFAAEIRKQTGILTGAVGLITEAQQAEHIINTGQADAVLLARELLRNPYWPLHAAKKLGAEVSWPPQYLRAK